MNPFDAIDFETIIQVLFVLLIVGGSIVQMIYRAFVKPLKQARKGKPGPGQASPPQLEKFLQEIRRERQARGQAKPAARPGREAGVERWEVVKDEEIQPRRGREPPGREARKAAREELTPRWEPARRGEAPQRIEPQPAAGGGRAAVAPQQARELQPAEAASRSLALELKDKRLSQVTERHIESQIEDRSLAATVRERHLRSGISSRLEARYGVTRKTRGSVAADIPGMPRGVGLREAVLLQAIFGPARSLQPRGQTYISGPLRGL